MAEEQAAHHLLNVLEERGLNVDLDKVLLGFENDETKADIAQWVEEYLHEDTLLTKEELELYQVLKKKGLLHQYESGEPTRPILDHEIASAIESLESSTAAIEEQCKVLEAQKSALLRLKALEKPSLDVEHARNDRRRKEGQEKARLEVAVEDMSTSIGEQLAESQKEIDMDRSALTSYLTERLASDDQILSRLPGIVSQIATEPQSTDDEKSVEQWCKAIVSFRTGEIKARVDTVYLKNLATASANGHSQLSEQEAKEQKLALQAEMEELHSEIASVAEMVVEHELRKPMSEMKERRDREVSQARSAWLTYVLSTLEYMGKRLDTISGSTCDANEYQHALAHISEAASKRMPSTPAVRPTPSRRATASTSSLAFTPMVKLKPTKTLDLPVALQEALRHAGVVFNQDSLEALQASLVRTQAEREKKLQHHFDSAAKLTHDKLAERFSRADNEIQVITDALYKHTPFHEVHLTNTKLETQLKAVERELEEKDRELLELEGNGLSLDDSRVRAFIAKYGQKR